MSKVRVIKIDGIVSDDVYKIVEVDTRKNLVTLEGTGGERFNSHRSRTLPLDSKGKAVAISTSGKYRGICPKCRNLVDVSDNHIECDCSGQIVRYEVVTHGTIAPVNAPHRKTQQTTLTTPRKESTMSDTSDTIETTTDTSEATAPVKEPFVVDLAEVKKYGELWSKDKVQFDHPTIDVKAFVLLADTPARKVCFNTYDGTLGKKAKNLAALKLENFRDHNPDDGKVVGYVLKRTLDEERKKLEKDGYTKV